MAQNSEKVSEVEGLAYYCHDFVDTDVISPGRFEPYRDRDHLSSVALIDYDGPVPFIEEGQISSKFSVIFAGNEFGCGSSRETAPQALSWAGARVVIARSFARIFFRNCINMGLIFPIRLDHPYGQEVTGQRVHVDIAKRIVTVGSNTHEFGGFGSLAEIVASGGLTAYNKARMKRGEL